MHALFTCMHTLDVTWIVYSSTYAIVAFCCSLLLLLLLRYMYLGRRLEPEVLQAADP